MNKDILKKATNFINNKIRSQEELTTYATNNNHKRFLFAVSSFFNNLPIIEMPNKDRILAKIKIDTIDYTLVETKSKSKSITSLSINFQRWAAAVVLIILSVGLWNYFYENSIDESKIIVQANTNEKLTFYLPDSSEVWLNKGSKLQYKSNFLEKREVILIGEAYFNVRKYENKDFDVNIDNALLKVLGTTFNIKSDNSGDLEVKLYTGKVNVTIMKNQQIVLAPMQKLNYIASEDDITLNKIDDDFDWKSNVYKFTDKPLEELILILKQLYDVQIEIKRTEFNKNVFSGKVILSEPIDNILDKICINTELTFSHTNNSIILY